jgi:serine/threonine-protein kinase RsbW
MPDRPGCARLRMVVPGHPLGVRLALKRLEGSSLFRTLCPDTRDTAELVLAEVRNNVVEHAYAGRTGAIGLHLSGVDGGLLCVVRDSGRPMPGAVLPQGNPPVIRPEDPPEGGFGWYLIRSLARDLKYRRAGGRNLLRLRIPAGSDKGAGSRLAL